MKLLMVFLAVLFVSSAHSHPHPEYEKYKDDILEHWECQLPEKGNMHLISSYMHRSGLVRLNNLPIRKTHYSIDGFDRIWKWEDELGQSFALRLEPDGFLVSPFRAQCRQIPNLSKE